MTVYDYYTYNKLGHEGERSEVEPFTPVRLKMPYSEVMMHLGLADKWVDVLLIEREHDGYVASSARLLKEGWTSTDDVFTLDVTTGEAGILTDRTRIAPTIGA